MANYLIVILYSREQMQKEGDSIDADWGVVGCMYAQEPEEIPMAPITMMRNALGVDEGAQGLRWIAKLIGAQWSSGKTTPTGGRSRSRAGSQGA